MKVLVVEDQKLMLDSLTRLLNAQSDFEVVGALTDASQALDFVKHTPTDLVLMDIYTKDGASGISAAKELRESFSDLKIVLMTAMPDITFIQDAKAAGVNSFVYKDVSSQQLLTVLRSTAQDYSTFPQPPAMPFLGYNTLTDRELQVLRDTCAGKSRKEIAQEHSLSENTIKATISSILTKTGYQSIAKLAIHAIANGFVVVMNDSDEASQ